MGFFSWIFLGLIAGALAKLIMPGKDGGGWIMTILLGVGGAFLGGYIGSFLGLGGVDEISIKNLATATGGALLILWGYKMYQSKKAS